MNPFRPFGPAMTAPPWPEALRAALGAGLGLIACDVLLRVVTPGAVAGQMLLVAPLGASAFLIFAVPNSPLAQPWSVVIGNTLAALLAIATVALLPAPLVAAPLAVLLAILGMAATRALHPPAGAVALATVLAAAQPGFPGLSFAFFPVAAGSIALVLAGILWNRATGRAYPFRQPPPATTEPPASRRLGLTAQELADLLDRLRMAPNIGVEDLARVLAAAETESTAHHLGGLTAADVMSRDLQTLDAGDDLDTMAAAFRRHRFKSLPVLAQGRYLGLVDQAALLGLSDPALTAADLAVDVPTLPPTAGMAPLMTRLAEAGQQAVPITDGGGLLGLVTRSDMVALLSARLRDG